WLNPEVLVIFRFLSDDAIDFDIDLRELQGQERLDLLCDFFAGIGRRLGKPSADVTRGRRGSKPSSARVRGRGRPRSATGGSSGQLTAAPKGARKIRTRDRRIRSGSPFLNPIAH